MKSMSRMNKKERGATVVEYALIVALLSIAVAATVVLVGAEVDAKFNEVVDCLQNQNCPS